MTRTARLLLFALSCLVLAPATLALAWHMPAFGAHPLPYGEAINAVATAERHVTNMVSAVNFDYRGIDTLGEESMLLCAVTGVSVLLRGARGESTRARPGRVHGQPLRPRSTAMTLIGRVAAPMVLLFGVYVALHAMSTPGGGFQGGVIIASGLLLAFLGDGYRAWRRIVPSHLMDAIEGGGALLFALSGLLGLLTGAAFLANVLPFGEPGSVTSGGLMIPINLGVAGAVAGGFAVLFGEFLEETRVEVSDRPAGGDT